MSELIQSWLNDEVQLSRRVTNFEKDFKNGFLLGELLSKYNQELNFHLFKDRDLRNDMINNYRLLEITLKTLRIDFNAQIAHSIIDQKKGEALGLLYLLKSALEKVHNPADIKVLDDTGRLNSIVPLKQIKPVREIYDKMESDLFSKRLDQLLPAQKEIDLQQKLEKFNQTRIVNEYRARQQVEEDRERGQQIQDEMRKMQINNLIRNKTFMEDWKAKGEIEWAKNRQIQKDREQRDNAFKLMTTMKEQQKALSAQKKEREDVLQGIEAFEANAGKLGIDLKHDPSQTKKAERSTFSGTGALNKLMEATLQSEAVRKERDKRRRKMIVDQARDQKDVELKKREMILLEKLQQQSKQENEIAYEVWRALQSKQVIIDNRTLRNDTYTGKKAEQQLIAQSKEENLLKQIIGEKERDFNQKMFRQRGLNVQQLSEKRLVDYKTCSGFLDYIFEIADLCFQHQQDNDTLDIDPRFWRDCCNLFVEEKPLIPKKSFRHPDATENITKTPTNDLTVSTSQLSFAELQDYLNGLGAWKPQHRFEPPKDPEDNQYIPNKPINNFNLGLIISNIIDMSSSQRAPLVVPADIPNYLPLRLTCLGYSFSGRKTLCDFLKRHYDINVLDMNDILKEAIDMSNAAIETEEQEKTDEDELELEENIQIASRKELDEFSHIGRKIKRCMLQGKSIPDDLYIEAILFKIKQLYPALTKDQFLDHLGRLKSKAEAQIQNAKRNADSDDEEETKDPSDKPSIYQQLNYTEGWILTGFPNNYEQLKALEKALSGFIPSDEQATSEAEEKKKRAELIVKAPPKTIIPKKLIRGGIDTAIVLDVTKEECLRRALGRRIDPKTGIVYHLDDNPPPIDNAPLMERLVPIKDPENSESILIDKLTRYDRVKEDMEKWTSLFGIEEQQLSCLQKFEGMGTEAEIHKRVQEYLDKLLSFKRIEYERSFIEVEEAEKKWQDEQELLKKMQEDEAKMVTTEQHIIREDLEILREKRIANLTIPPELLTAMTSLWEVIQETYISEATDFFTVIKEQRNFITVRIGELQRRFLELIKKEDDRLLIVSDFQKSYNKFLDENTDMIEEEDTKEELHQRVEDLYQQLWEVIENKKENLIEERKAVMSSGYVEDEMELLTANIQKLMQAELDRYFGCVQIIQDYYCTLEGKDIPEQPENMMLDILPKAEITFPPIEDPEGPEPYPRIDLFYKNALKVLNGEELEEPAAKDAKKPGAKAPAKKEDPKKPTGKKDKDAPPEEEKKELTPLEKEMKETINLEKAILRYRLFLIKSLGTDRIREMRQKAKTLYSKLEDWLNYGIKAENDAVSELANLLGEAIENQTKIQNELLLSYVDVVKSYKYLNFLTPPPVLLPPMEIKKPNRFTITQLKALISQLASLTQPSGIIDNNLLLAFFTQRSENSFGKDDFPEDWKTKSFKDYQKVIKNLDPEAKGYVQFKALCTALCLLATPVPKEEDILEYQTVLSNNTDNGMIDLANFINCNAFFDRYESSDKTETNSKQFDRASLIKDILFDINKDEEKALVDVNEFIKTLTTIQNFNPKDDNKEPFEVQADGLARSQLRDSALSPARNLKKSRRQFIKTYTNMLFD